MELPIELTKGMLTQRGCCAWTGASIKNLRSWCPRGFLPSDQSRAQIERLAWWQVDRVLESCLELNVAKHVHERVVEGQVRLCETEITSGELPLKLFSLSGSPIEGVKSITMGTGSTFVQMLEYEITGRIPGLEAQWLTNRCVPASLAAAIPTLPHYVRAPGASWELEMAREFNEELQAGGVTRPAPNDDRPDEEAGLRS